MQTGVFVGLSVALCLSVALEILQGAKPFLCAAAQRFLDQAQVDEPFGVFADIVEELTAPLS